MKNIIKIFIITLCLTATACTNNSSSTDSVKTDSSTIEISTSSNVDSIEIDSSNESSEIDSSSISETDSSNESSEVDSEDESSKAVTTTKTIYKETAKATTTRVYKETAKATTTTKQTTTQPAVTTKPYVAPVTTTTKPVVTTKATTKPVTTTTKTTTAKPSSDIARQTKYLDSYDMYEIVTEYKSRHAICEKGIASMAAEINKIRKANGLNTLKVNPLLTKAAMIRARELAETYVKYGGISHTRPNGEYASSVVGDVGYDGNAFENAYYAFDWIDWKECLRVWLNSPDHKRNILDKGHEVMGLAIINVKIRNQYEGEGGGGRFTFAIQLFD